MADDLLDLIPSDTLVAELEDWAKRDHDAFIQVIGDAFDATDQRATDATPKEVKRLLLEDGDLYADVEFTVDYEYTSEGITTEQVADHRQTIVFRGAHALGLDQDEIGATQRDVFP